MVGGRRNKPGVTGRIDPRLTRIALKGGKLLVLRPLGAVIERRSAITL